MSRDGRHMERGLLLEKEDWLQGKHKEENKPNVRLGKGSGNQRETRKAKRSVSAGDIRKREV